MYWTKESTVNDFVGEINKWIKLRLQLAEDCWGLPTMDRVSGYIQTMLEQLSKAPLGLSQIAEQYQSDMVFDFWTTLLLDHETEDGLNAGYTLYTRLSADKTFPLMVIRLAEDTVDIEETRVKIYRSASCEMDGNTFLSDIFAEAIQLQSESKVPIQERWLSMDFDFRRKHPICPVCCSPVEGYKGDYTSGYSLSCTREGCCFYRERKYKCVDDFVEEKAFRKEMRFFKKVQEAEQAEDEALEEVRVALQKAHKILKESSRYFLNPYDISNSVTQIQDIAESMKKDIDSIFNISSKG